MSEQGIRVSKTRANQNPALLIFCAVFFVAATAQADVRRAQTLKAKGQDSLYLVRSADSHEIRTADGQTLPLDLPTGARVADFAGSFDAWAAIAEDGTADQTRFVVLQGQGEQSQRVPDLPTDDVGMLAFPRALLGPDGLAGAAWLAGDGPRSMAVRAARFDGKGWSPPVTVAKSGPGTQTALAAATLADGSWLLAWSAFDGEDDEILWSRFGGKAWTQPARSAEDNSTPDITPSLVALPEEGALLAWSRFTDGQYRVFLAKLGEQGWSRPTAQVPNGSVRPELDLDAGVPLLLYRRPAAGTWAVAELDNNGKAVRRAELVTGQVTTPPALGRCSDEGVELRWLEKSSSPRLALWR